MNIVKKLKNSRYAYIISYTAVFCLFCAVCFGYFFQYRKSFIWYQDGLKQHYNALLYYSKYLRGILKNFLSGDFTVPMWDFSIGYGSDILTTLHYHCIGDPLCLLSVLVPEHFMEYFYCLLYIIRLYLGGLFCSVFYKYHGVSRFGTLAGSLIYAFSGYSLVLGLMHINFLVPMVYFPIILLGIDLIFDRKSPLVFIVGVALSGLSNFYFFYMQLFLAVLYAVYRLVRLLRNTDAEGRLTRLKLIGGFAGRFALYGLDGIFIAMPVLLPVVSFFTASGRYASEKKVPFLYTPDYYTGFFADFANLQRPGYWLLLGYTPVAVLSILILFVKHRKDTRGIRIIFLVLTAFALLPVAGFALNGFAYVTNRWVWAYGMAVGFITALVLSDDTPIEENARKMLAGLAVLVSVLSLLLPENRTVQTGVSVALLMALTLLMLNFPYLTAVRWRRCCLFGIFIFFGIALNANFKYSVAKDDWLSEFLSFHEADRKLLNENYDDMIDEAAAKDGAENSFFRTEELSLSTTQNSSLQRRFRGTQFYFSMTNPYISRFINLMYFNWPKDYDYAGVDGRAALDAIASVRYCLAGQEGENDLPFTYDIELARKEGADGEVRLMGTEHSLPLGYVYGSQISEAQFESMSVTQRARALLKGAVVETPVNDPANIEVEDNAYSILREIETRGNARAESDGFFIGKGGSLVLKLDDASDAEKYAVFKGLGFIGVTERDSFDDGGWAGLTPYEKSRVAVNDRFYTSPGVTSMRFSVGDSVHILEYYLPGADYYCGRKDFLVNLGRDAREAEVTFRHPGFYTFDSFDVLAQPTAGIAEDIDALRETVLTGESIGVNSVSGKVSLDAPGFLVMSIPYSSGWKAEVDGAETSVTRADIMYMGLPLSKGTHEVRLYYRTPYIKAGFILCLIGILGGIACAIHSRLKNRNIANRE